MFTPEQRRLGGQRAGQKTLRERGPAFYAKIGEKGGNVTAERTTTERWQELGRRGGLKAHPRPVYFFVWKNNCKRLQLRGRRCVVLARSRYAGSGTRWNSRLVEFLDDGHCEIVSGRALRRVDKK